MIYNDNECLAGSRSAKYFFMIFLFSYCNPDTEDCTSDWPLINDSTMSESTGFKNKAESLSDVNIGMPDTKTYVFYKLCKYVHVQAKSNVELSRDLSTNERLTSYHFHNSHLEKKRLFIRLIMSPQYDLDRLTRRVLEMHSHLEM